MTLISTFAHHKVAANLLMILMILSGIFALNKLNIQFFPNFELDRISVRVIWSGASAEDIEKGITIPLEQLLKTVDNLHKMTSTSAQNVSSILMEFSQDADMVEALNKVKQKVDEFRNLPKEAEKPIVETLIRYEGVAKVQISGAIDREEMRRLANSFERDLIRRGLDKIDINGLPDEEIAIEISSDQLQQLQMNLNDIATKINKFSLDLPIGTFAYDDSAKELRALQQGRSEKDFADIPIRVNETEYIRLGDVAQIEKRKKRGGVTRTVEGQQVVELSILRSEKGNALRSANILHQWLEDVKPTLPPTVQLAVYDESWKLIKERTNLLLTNGGTGLFLVVLILYIFLNGRVAIWVAIGIPVSFMATLAILYAVGGSINMISLFALIMALGIIVDDAIVVGEDALAHYQDGEVPLMAAEGGARRMFVPVVASSLTTVAAFLPLMMIGGIMGNILFDIPLVIICVILASLVESFFILPGHLRHAFLNFKRDSEDKTSLRAKFDRGFEKFRDGLFRSVVVAALEYRGITLSLVFSLLVLSFALLAGGRIGYSFFPSPESHIVYANVSFVSGTSKETTNAYLKHMEDMLYETEQQLGKGLVETAITIHGSNYSGGSTNKGGDQLGAIYLQLQDPDRRSVRNETFINTWKDKLKEQSGIESLTITSRKTGPQGNDITIRLSGGDNETMKLAATELSEALKKMEGVYGVDNDMPYGKEQLVFSLTAAGKALGLSVEDIGLQLRAAFDGKLVQIYQDGTEEVEVRVMLSANERNFLKQLNNAYIRLNSSNSSGDFVALSSVANWYSRHGFEVLRHAGGELAIEVLADVDNNLNKTNLILKDLEQNALKEIQQKYSLDYSFEGRSADEKETTTDMKHGVLLGLTIIYLVLTWVFQSYGWPLIVMSIIPFGLVGAIAGHWVMGIDMTLLSLFGFFGLSGIVVNDSIILVSFYKRLREQGMEIQKALVKASSQRLRAVLLTSLTTIAGLTPLLFETSLQAQFLIPMATSIAFGLMFSTIIVLFIVPVLLSFYEGLLGKKQIQIDN
jgi:multidrug efflux pump subunit AcrB